MMAFIHVFATSSLDVEGLEISSLSKDHPIDPEISSAITTFSDFRHIDDPLNEDAKETDTKVLLAPPFGSDTVAVSKTGTNALFVVGTRNPNVPNVFS